MLVVKERRAILGKIPRIAASQQDVLPLLHLFLELQLHCSRQLHLLYERCERALLALYIRLHPGQEHPRAGQGDECTQAGQRVDFGGDAKVVHGRPLDAARVIGWMVRSVP